jgi:hypothetical protein
VQNVSGIAWDRFALRQNSGGGILVVSQLLLGTELNDLEGGNAERQIGGLRSFAWSSRSNSTEVTGWLLGNSSSQEVSLKASFSNTNLSGAISSFDPASGRIGIRLERLAARTELVAVTVIAEDLSGKVMTQHTFNVLLADRGQFRSVRMIRPGEVVEVDLQLPTFTNTFQQVVIPPGWTQLNTLALSPTTARVQSPVENFSRAEISVIHSIQGIQLTNTVELLSAPAVLPLRDQFTTALSNSWITHGGVAGETIATNGGLRLSSSNSEDLHRRLEFTSTVGTNVNLAICFAFRVHQLPSSNGTYFAHLKDSGSSARAKLLIKRTAGNGFSLGIANNSTDTAVFLPSTLLPQQWYCAVIEYNSATGTTLRLRGHPAGEQTVSDRTPFSPIVPDSFAVRQNSGMGSIELSDLQIANSISELQLPQIAPRLEIRMSAEGVQLTWEDPAGDWLVQTAETLSGEWRNIETEQQINGNLRSVLLPTGSAGAFFRLSPALD